jgi:hypothetical protein
MIKRYVASYIDSLKKEDIVSFLKGENIVLSDDEIDFCFSYIKKNWSLLFENQNQIFLDLKNHLNPTTYKQVLPILEFYQKKYKNYL